jgi:hypothetical protein
MATGLQPRDFTWVIKGRLAVSQRVGGYGDHHRRIRREEELTWLTQNGFTGIMALCESAEGFSHYREVGLDVFHQPVPAGDESGFAKGFFDSLGKALVKKDATVLVHRDFIDDTIVGLLGGYLVASGMLESPVQAMAIIQEIAKRPLGPLGRSLIPVAR